MKILVLADIHANWPALAAIRETFDACLFAGDLVDYGTDPIPCIEWMRKHATAAVRGNHDHAVAQHVAAKGGNGLRVLTAATRPIHWNILSASDTRYLARLPATNHVTVGDHRFLLVHGTPRDPLDEYLNADAEAWSLRLESVEADFVCVGHTHLPFHLQLERLQVLNPGSVGQPRDGDPRASYAVIEDGVVDLRRIEYDIEATLRQMRDVGLEGPPYRVAEAMLRTGGKLPEEFA